MFRRRKPISGDLHVNKLGPEDLADVFGGPPRKPLFRQPDRSTFPSLFYERMFWPDEEGRVAEMVGRRLPEFKIPLRSGSENEGRNNRFDSLEWGDHATAHSRSSSELILFPRKAASSGWAGNGVSIFSAKFRTEKCEPNDIDEAIAWAKQKFQTQCAETNKCGIQGSDQEKPTQETPTRSSLSDRGADDHGSQQNKCSTEEETKQLQILDEKIRVWSTGKEADIRLLLSTLHHILWPSSGWLAISLTNLIQRTQVKKAYQKARLCLHPDKLQQRDATVAQKYISAKAFPILQDAWAAFISLQVC